MKQGTQEEKKKQGKLKERKKIKAKSNEYENRKW